MKFNPKKTEFALIALLVATALAGAVSKLRLAFSYPLDGDHIMFARWFYDMTENHNYLLSNWYIATNNFLFTDYPIHFALGSALGMSGGTLRGGAFLVFLLTALALGAIMNRLFGPRPALLGSAVFLASAPGIAKYLLMPNFHAATALYALVSLYLLLRILSRADDDARRWPFALLVAGLFVLAVLNVVSDYLYIFIFVVPAILSLGALRVLGRGLMPFGRELMVYAALVLATATAVVLVSLSEQIGLHLAFASHNRIIALAVPEVLSALGQTVRDTVGLFALKGGAPVGILNAVLFGIAMFQTVRLVLFEHDGHRRFAMLFFALTAGLLWSAHVIRQVAHPYYLVPLLYVYAAGLGTVLTRPRSGLPGAGSNPLAKAAIMAVVLVALLASGSNVARGLAAKPPVQPLLGLAKFLAQNGLHYGYSNIGQGNLLTFLSNNEVKVRPVRFDNSRIEPDIFHINFDWYDYKEVSGPTFLIVTDGHEERGFGQLEEAGLRKMFGSPARSLRYKNHRIYEWRHNIIQSYWIDEAMKVYRPK